jgi:hypothetical protein
MQMELLLSGMYSFAMPMNPVRLEIWILICSNLSGLATVSYCHSILKRPSRFNLVTSYHCCPTHIHQLIVEALNKTFCGPREKREKKVEVIQTIDE